MYHIGKFSTGMCHIGIFSTRMCHPGMLQAWNRGLFVGIINSVDNVNSVHSVHHVNSVHNVQTAHPNMEDANVAPLDKPDDDFPDTNMTLVQQPSQNVGVACFGPKIHQNGKRGLHSGCHVLPELK